MVVQRLTWGQGRHKVAVREAVACLEKTRPVGPLNGPGPTGLDSRKAGIRRYCRADGGGRHIKNPNSVYKHCQFMSPTVIVLNKLRREPNRPHPSPAITGQQHVKLVTPCKRGI